jgi:hypothetical protein
MFQVCGNVARTQTCRTIGSERVYTQTSYAKLRMLVEVPGQLSFFLSFNVGLKVRGTS